MNWLPMVMVCVMLGIMVMYGVVNWMPIILINITLGIMVLCAVMNAKDGR